jgi:hypothetical protein
LHHERLSYYSEQSILNLRVHRIDVNKYKNERSGLDKQSVVDAREEESYIEHKHKSVQFSKTTNKPTAS